MIYAWASAVCMITVCVYIYKGETNLGIAMFLVAALWSIAAELYYLRKGRLTSSARPTIRKIVKYD